MTHWCIACSFETEDEEEAYAHDCMGPPGQDRNRGHHPDCHRYRIPARARDEVCDFDLCEMPPGSALRGVEMADPAVEAVKRVAGRDHTLPTDQIVAAREALKPIRELIERWEEFGDELDIDDLKKLVYPKEEL